VGRSLAGRPLGGGLLANAMRDRRSGGCGRVRAAAAPHPHRHVTVSKRQKFSRVRPLCRYYSPKYRFGRGTLRLSRTMLERGQKANFQVARKNLPFCTIVHFKNSEYRKIP